MRKHRWLPRVSMLACMALIGSLFVASGSSAHLSSNTALQARGYAFGATENALPEPNVKAPEAIAEAPPSEEQEQVRTQRDRDILLDAVVAQVGHVEADACLDAGVPAKLQMQANHARIVARGEEPADDDNDTNDGPNDEDPQRQEVVPLDPAFPDSCVEPVDANHPRPVFGAPQSPGATAQPTAAPTGTPPPPPNCEEFEPPEAAGDPTTCLATLPLWHGRGYARPLDTLLGEEVIAEAVARCTPEGQLEVQTGFDSTGLVLSTVAGADFTLGPNHTFDLLGLGLVTGGVVTFWETNWDPETNTTTDGSDTVWVNGAHIITPAEEIIIGHAEATANCVADEEPGFAPTPPPGGFPRDINIKPSKRTVLYSKIFTLAGSITPATEFETPRTCVENVTLTIRRDPIGGPEEFVDVGQVTTDNNGNYTFNYPADRNSQWLAFIDKDNPTDCAQASSNAFPVLVKPFVRLKMARKSVPEGSFHTMRVSVEPCGEHAGTRIKLKRQVGASMVEVDTKKLDADCRAVFRVRANFREGVFQAAWPKQDEDHQTGKSRKKLASTH